LAGAPLLGAYRSHRGGHRLNYSVLSALMADQTAWRMIDMPAPAGRRASGHADAVPGLVAPAYSPEVS
jgi:UDP-3-O-[3-hydroxymyristoyl] N-acetylglucosamine deacetylase